MVRLQQSEPKGTVPVGYCTIDVANVPGKKWCFEIVNGRYNDEKDLLLQAESEEGMVDWVGFLRAAKFKAIQEKYRMVKLYF